MLINNILLLYNFLVIAFAELQTDMTDLTTDLENSRKPYHDYDEYTFRILFPGMFDHIILQPPQVLTISNFL